MRQVVLLAAAVCVLLISSTAAAAAAADIYLWTDKWNSAEYYLRTETYQCSKHGESVMVLKTDTLNPKMPPFIWVYSFYQTESGTFYEVTQHNRNGTAKRLRSGNIKDNYGARKAYVEMRKHFKSPC